MQTYNLATISLSEIPHNVLYFLYFLRMSYLSYEKHIAKRTVFRKSLYKILNTWQSSDYISDKNNLPMTGSSSDKAACNYDWLVAMSIGQN